jgi:menaquinone-dependent protoporphyrinogen oxidase
MADVLIVYATEEGQAQKIAGRIGDELMRCGNHADVHPVETNPLVSHYDAVVIGSSLHGGRFAMRLVEFVRQHKRAIDSMPNAFFGVCLAAGRDDEEGRRAVRGYLARFVTATDWLPDDAEAFAGALRFSRYGPLKRWMVRRVARRNALDVDSAGDQELTNWEDVTSFAKRLHERLERGMHPT